MPRFRPSRIKSFTNITQSGSGDNSVKFTSLCSSKQRSLRTNPTRVILISRNVSAYIWDRWNSYIIRSIMGRALTTLDVWMGSLTLKNGRRLIKLCGIIRVGKETTSGRSASQFRAGSHTPPRCTVCRVGNITVLCLRI